MYRSRVDEHKKLCDDIHDLYVRKNKDYGGSVTNTYKKYGMISFLVRMEDKLNRIEALTKNKSIEIKTESVRDTLIDLANYALLAVLELDDDVRQRQEMTEELTMKSTDIISPIYNPPQQVKPGTNEYIIITCTGEEFKNYEREI